MSGKLLTPSQAAEILQLKTDGVYRLVREGWLPAIRVGAKKLRFDEAELRQWIANGGVQETKRAAN